MYVAKPPIEVGSHPGKGTWRCLRCNWRVKLESDWEPLPPCGGDCAKDPGTDATKARYARVRGLVD
jgi:hypothetical protein